MAALLAVLAIHAQAESGQAGADAPKAERARLEAKPSDAIGNGDGVIHIIPALSSPSVKNGGKMTVSAVVKASAGVREVKAEIRDGDRVLDTLNLVPGNAFPGSAGVSTASLATSPNPSQAEERARRPRSQDDLAGPMLSTRPGGL